jgi:hypothetical protein
MRVSTEYNGHAIELEFDQSRVVINQAVLHVDGREVDKTRVFYGEKDLKSTLEDGTEITVRLHSGMTGELTRAQLRKPDGSWVDLAS